MQGHTVILSVPVEGVHKVGHATSYGMLASPVCHCGCGQFSKPSGACCLSCVLPAGDGDGQAGDTTGQVPAVDQQQAEEPVGYGQQ